MEIEITDNSTLAKEEMRAAALLALLRSGVREDALHDYVINNGA